MPRNVLGAALFAAAGFVASSVASSAARADEEAPARAPAPAPAPAPSLSSVRGWLAGGASEGEVWGVGLTALHGTLGIVADHGRHLSVPATLEVDLGRTPAGLGTGQVAAAVAPQVRFGRARVGGGPELTYFWLGRAYGAEMPPVDAIGLGLFALASVDLFELGGDRAVALLARGEVVYLRGPDSFFRFDRGAAAPRGSLALGVRF